MADPDPSRIMHIGTAFFAAKTLLSAVELGLFTELAQTPMTGREITSALGLHQRAIPCSTRSTNAPSDLSSS